MGAISTDSVYAQASGFAIQAREDGRAAYYRRRGLEYCPHLGLEKFYLAFLWKVGWLEAEREAAGGWLSTLIGSDALATQVEERRFGAGASSYAN